MKLVTLSDIEYMINSLYAKIKKRFVSTEQLDEKNYAPKDYVTDKINESAAWIGTMDEYNEANSQGLISIGQIVIIVDKDVDINIDNNSGTSSILGQAILGTMILGKEK